MEKLLRVLIVEDSEDDTLLLLRILAMGGYEPIHVRVETAAAMRDALCTTPWDMILCDYNMPSFNGIHAISLLREMALDIPIIIVSGTIGEETAVECMRAGAGDYVMKGNLPRLLPAVERELKEAKARLLYRQADEALHESEERCRAFFEHSKDAILLTSPEDGSILDANPAACAMFGRPLNEIRTVGRNGLVDTADPRFHGALAERARQGKTAAEITMVRANGEKFPAEITSAIFCDKYGKQKTSMIIRDVSDRKQMEEHIRQSQKVEAIGQLAGGVAHDFNNMLGVILGYVEMSMTMVDSADKLYSNLVEIRKAVERSSSLTHQLLAFARNQTISPQVIDLNESICGVLMMLRRLIGEDIQLDFIPDQNQCPVFIDPVQIDQILTNLCVNARDAIERDGKITIETMNIALGDSNCGRHAGVPPGDYTLLLVSDNGCGMDKNVQEKVFEPFFTTKAKGKGTGLGLSTVSEIVKNNKFFINLASIPGRGTTFTIYLPRTIEEGEATAVEELQKPAARRETETLLLVEDEQALLYICKTVLEGVGYTVLIASTPTEALALAAEFGGKIDLLLTDVILPEMNGNELSKKIIPLCNNIKCLFISGYAVADITSHGALEEGAHFLRKPFSVTELTGKIRKVLDQG